MSDAPETAAEGSRHAEHNLMATFPSVEGARNALTHLERKGIEAGNIELGGRGMEGAEGPQTNEAVQEADLAVTGRVAKRSITGIVAGAIVGALIGLGGGLLFFATRGDGEIVTTAIFGAAFGGALFGAFLGGFYGGATGLPVSEQFSETFESVRGGETTLSVHSATSDQIDKAVAALRGMSPSPVRMSLFGKDGKLTDIR